MFPEPFATQASVAAHAWKSTACLQWLLNRSSSIRPGCAILASALRQEDGDEQLQHRHALCLYLFEKSPPLLDGVPFSTTIEKLASSEHLYHTILHRRSLEDPGSEPCFGICHCRTDKAHDGNGTISRAGSMTRRGTYLSCSKSRPLGGCTSGYTSRYVRPSCASK